MTIVPASPGLYVFDSDISYGSVDHLNESLALVVAWKLVDEGDNVSVSAITTDGIFAAGHFAVVHSSPGIALGSARVTTLTQTWNSLNGYAQERGLKTRNKWDVKEVRFAAG